MTTLTQLQRDLIFGSLLGDACLSTETQGRTWRYRALQKGSDYDYLNNKYIILKNLCNSPPKVSEVLDPRTNKISQRCFFNTLTNPALKFYSDMFYTFDSKTQRWVKDVPLNISQYFTPTAVAYFYMDDGSLKYPGNSNAMRICTEGFSVEGTIRIQKAFKQLYNIDTTLTSKPLKNGEMRKRIAIPEASSAPFRNLIEPYLVQCMKYKVSDGNRGHL